MGCIVIEKIEKMRKRLHESGKVQKLKERLRERRKKEEGGEEQ